MLAAVVPYCIRIQISSGIGDTEILNNTLVGTVGAILVGSWLMRNVATYPGSEALASTLPSFFAAFGFLMIVFIFARIPYNRTILLIGFTVSFTWFFVLEMLRQRVRHLRIGILPFGDITPFISSPNVYCRVLKVAGENVDDLDAIAADFRTDLPREWDRQLADYALARIPVYHIKHLVESLTGQVELEHLSENSFGSLAPRQDYMLVKGVIDWLMALVMGVALLPLLFTIGLLVRVTSSGPALFRQERIGYQGRPFIVFKFRTMKVASAGGDLRSLAITREKDNRVTSIGRFLRASRIDELPQLLNILRGEMSWIGPRPEAAVLSRWYESEIPFYRYRHIVRPGIAGWAQVCQGHVANIDEVRSKLHYDFYYIKHYSPWIDLLIVVRTIRTMITGFGAR